MLVVSPIPELGLNPVGPHCTIHCSSVPPGFHEMVAESLDIFETCKDKGWGHEGEIFTSKLSTITSLDSLSSIIPSLAQNANWTIFPV